MWRTVKTLAALLLVGVSCHAMFHTGGAPASWGLVSLSAWGCVLILRGWRTMHMWEQRLLMWAIFSILSFAHFLQSDPTFKDWSSVYYFCGPDFAYCTTSFRWNLRGWRKAIALWNFCLSSALALQRLAIEAGLGGLLPGEDVVTRESFISIAWRLIPFWLNRWESDFGAECSSVLFELPHFALELLVVLPLVQILAGRLRLLAHPHLLRMEAQGGAGRGREGQEPPALAPDVLRCSWGSDSAQLRLLPRLRANLRVMTMICLVSWVAAVNALYVPLALERQAALSPRSSDILAFSAELDAVAEAGVRAEAARQQQWRLGRPAEMSAAVGTTAGACLAAGNCSSALAVRLEAAYLHSTRQEQQHQHPPSPDAAGGPSGSTVDAAAAEANELLVPLDWALQLLDIEEGEGDKMQTDPNRLEALLFRAPLPTPLLPWPWAGMADGQPAAALLPSLPSLPALPSLPSLSSLPSLQSLPSFQEGLQSLQSLLPSLSQPAPIPGLAQLKKSRTAYLSRVAEAEAAAAATAQHQPSPNRASPPPPPPSAVLPRLYRSMHKHSAELRRMLEPEHKALVPLVEAALAVMRLSCERWFALIGVFAAYLLFRDPPPAARAVVCAVAFLSRAFQRAILLSFPAVCWVYGAGFMFSMFASLIFWAGPAMRGLEQLRSATAAVRPRDWHSATEEEVERMGGVCAICWGELSEVPAPANDDNASVGGGAAAALEEEGEAAAESGGGETTGMPVGLPCRHAYHRQCLNQWLQSCYAQSRTPSCPMCQAEIAVQIRYRMPAARAGEGGGGAAAAQHRREPGIPGLDALVDALPDEYRRHRFELPVGDLRMEAEAAAAGGGGGGAAGPRDAQQRGVERRQGERQDARNNNNNNNNNGALAQQQQEGGAAAVLPPAGAAEGPAQRRFGRGLIRRLFVRRARN